jgi:osmotically-inducible protein OsmY
MPPGALNCEQISALEIFHSVRRKDMSVDREIIRKIEGTLTRDKRVNLNSGTVEISCEGGYVTLTGTVPTVAAKRLAVRLTQELPEVKSVRDELRVTTDSPMGDLQIADHVRHAFIQERNIEEQNIEIETAPEGVVILKGHVHALAYTRLCEVLCWWVPGVTEIRNLLVVDPPEEDSDEELKDNLITIMEKDVLVNPSKFRLDVREGKVTLRGQVDSKMEKDAAEKDCWYTPGVIDVSNELTVS